MDYIMSKIKDLKGKRFGRLVALTYSEDKTKAKNRIYWECLCDCGNITRVASGHLISEHTKSCGCLAKESCKIRSITHGMSHTKEHNAWFSLKNRCLNEKVDSFATYGALGITFDESFLNFENFLNEIGKCPSNSRYWSVDRIDNTKGYVKGNIRWATAHQQARNKSKLKSNTSGVTGVHFFVNKKYNLTEVRCSWREEVEDGVFKQKSKGFSVKKYGLLPAFAKACKYREEQIKRLNELGYGYTENHGRDKL